MKTSLEHLPADKQEQIFHIVALIKKMVAPEKIILFGSYAKGGHVEHEYFDKDGIRYQYYSDYDFLVVTEKNNVKAYEIENQIEEKGHSRKIPVSIELHEIDYINEGLGFGQYFFTDIINEGIMLYDTGKFQFAEPRVLTPAEQKVIAQRYFDTWFPQSQEFIIDSTNALNRGSYKIGVFYLHQTTESLYNAALLVFTGYKPKTHNLWKLRKRAKGISQELFLVFATETNKEENYLFDLLKRGYIDARYKQDYQIKEFELESLINRIKEMSIVVEKICKEKIDSFTGEV